MKAYILNKNGGPEVLKIHDTPEPSPKENQVKVKIQKIGINYAEILSRRGQYSWAPKKPYTPGMEAYGEIVEVGNKVTTHKVNDLVITGSQTGAYAEFIVVPEYLAFPAVEGFSPSQNAAYLVNFMTAWMALVKLGKLQENENVLIHAAAGGVGTAAVQLGSALKAKVFGTASNDKKLELISELGGDFPINYSKDDFEKIIKENGGADVILEVVGGEVFRKSVKSLNPFGRLVVVGFASISFNKWKPWTIWQTWKDAPKVNVMKMAQGSYGIMGTHIGYLTGNETIAKNEYKALVEFTINNSLQPIVGREFDFNELPEAHKWMESRESIGKLIIFL